MNGCASDSGYEQGRLTSSVGYRNTMNGDDRGIVLTDSFKGLHVDGIWLEGVYATTATDPFCQTPREQPPSCPDVDDGRVGANERVNDPECKVRPPAAPPVHFSGQTRAELAHTMDHAANKVHGGKPY